MDKNLTTDSNYEEAKKALTLLLMNKYDDLLQKEIEAKEEEIKAYKSMQIFGDDFTPDDFKNLLVNISKIAGRPDLQTQYYEKVHDDAQKEKISNIK